MVLVGGPNQPMPCQSHYLAAAAYILLGRRNTQKRTKHTDHDGGRERASQNDEATRAPSPPCYKQQQTQNMLYVTNSRGDNWSHQGGTNGRERLNVKPTMTKIEEKESMGCVDGVCVFPFFPPHLLVPVAAIRHCPTHHGVCRRTLHCRAGVPNSKKELSSIPLCDRPSLAA